MKPRDPWFWILLAWTVSLLGTLGSLFFSEVMRYPPCVLCWYQRIGIYPLVAVFTVGFLGRDPRVGRYAWPLVAFGLLAAVYHNLLYYGLIPETVSPCTGGVPCTGVQFEGLGFLTIPLLSLFAFFAIGGCLLRFRVISRSENETR